MPKWLSPQRIVVDRPGEELRLASVPPSWLVRAYARLAGRVVSLTADSGQLSVAIARGPRLRVTTARVPRESIERAQLVIGEEVAGRCIPIDLEVHYAAKALALTMEIEGLDRRSEAMDFAYRLASAWGLRGYRVSERGDHRAVVELLLTLDERASTYRSDPEKGLYEIAEPLPHLEGVADYHATHAPVRPRRRPWNRARILDRVLFALRTTLYIALWALVGVPGGIAAWLVVALLLVVVDIAVYIAFGVHIAADFLAPRMKMLTILSAIFGLVLSSIFAVGMAIEDHRE